MKRTLSAIAAGRQALCIASLLHRRLPPWMPSNLKKQSQKSWPKSRPRCARQKQRINDDEEERIEETTRLVG